MTYCTAFPIPHKDLAIMGQDTGDPWRTLGSAFPRRTGTNGWEATIIAQLVDAGQQPLAC